MNICTLAAFAFLGLSIGPPAAAQAPHYRWIKGETLRFLIQRDPYFADPKAAIETVNPDAPYRSPVVERLTEKVLSVSAEGTATLTLTLAAEPGFEDDDTPQPVISRTAVVTSAGQVLSVSGAAPGNSPAERDLLRGIVPLTPVSSARKDGLVVETRVSPPSVTESTSPDHDGTLRQTTSAALADHLVFDSHQGQMVRQTSTMTIILSLVMTGRGRRGSDDFGRVIPSVRVVQTLTVEGKTVEGKKD